MKKSFSVTLIIMLIFSGVAYADAPSDFNKGVDALNDGHFAEAAKFLRKAAEQGLAEAQYYLGVMYSFGHGVPQDNTEAIKLLRKAAEQGHSSAQHNLGVMYDKGRGVPIDYKEAAKWYRKAAEQGLVEAQNNLGLMYKYGNGVQKNYTEAVKWFRKAAEHGDPPAQYNLGLMFGNGNGVPQSHQMAYVWLTIAIRALQGEELKYAKESRDFAATKLSPEQLAEAQKISSEWKPQ